MKKISLLLLILTLQTYANINVVVSILPQQTFVKAIGGVKVDVSLMVKPGNSPHTYEPKPSQMIAITKADLYFAIDVEFEHVWLPKFKNSNSNLLVVDLAEGINKIHMASAHEGHSHAHESDDPHIWTTPKNVKIIAKNIYNALAKQDSNNTSYFKNNLDTFLASVEHTDVQIKKILSTLKENRTFMVFHPSWGYFAKTYNLKQLAVEIEGKNPKPRELMHLIKEAKTEKAQAIFTQPEFSDASAKIIANELDIPVIKVSPMSANWSENLLNIANTIAGKR